MSIAEAHSAEVILQSCTCSHRMNGKAACLQSAATG